MRRLDRTWPGAGAVSEADAALGEDAVRTADAAVSGADGVDPADLGDALKEEGLTEIWAYCLLGKIFFLNFF